MKRLMSFTVSLLAASPIAAEPTSKADLGRKMWSAFVCGEYAIMADDKAEYERLFKLGLTSGRDFISALQKKEISGEEIRSKVPMAVSMSLGGPSADFMIGRIYAGASSDAYDTIAKRDSAGLLLPSEKWVVMDEPLKKKRAENHYRKENCSLIR